MAGRGQHLYVLVMLLVAEAKLAICIKALGCLGHPVTFNNSVGTFGINGDQYQDSMMCNWTIQAGTRKMIKLEFTRFNTESKYDNVYIYDGVNSSGVFLSKFSGSSLPDDSFFYNSISVSFHTDGSITRSGFVIKYRVFEACGSTPVVLGGAEGTIGIQTNQHELNRNCSWNIQPKINQRVRLHFLQLALERSVSCRLVNIKIYDGKNTTSPPIHTLCGSTVPKDIVSSGNAALVVFSSGLSSRNSSFKIKYSSYIPEEAGCAESPATLIGPEGSFGINASQYQNNMYCGWKIEVNETKIVRLHFLRFSLEGIMCLTDSVRIYDGKDSSAPLLKTFCGKVRPPDVFSSGNTMFVSFVTDGSLTYNGFRITYSTATVNCDSGWYHNETTATCVMCPRGFYKNKDQDIRCQPCPRHLITPGIGATAKSDCLQGNCTAGQMIEGKACKLCPLGTYQSEKWQTECTSCGNKMSTIRVGAMTKDECVSTDSCSNGNNNCTSYDNGGTCTLVWEGPKYTCGCREGWTLHNNTLCIHVCNRGYCLHGGVCNKHIPESPVCICAKGYDGVRCSKSRHDVMDKTTMSIVVGFGVLVFIVVLLVVFFCGRKSTSTTTNARVRYLPAFTNETYEPCLQHVG